MPPGVFFCVWGGQNFFAAPWPTPSRASARGTWGSKTAARSIEEARHPVPPGVFFCVWGGQNFFAAPWPTPSRASARGTWGSKTAARSIETRHPVPPGVFFCVWGRGETFLRSPKGEARLGSPFGGAVAVRRLRGQPASASTQPMRGGRWQLALSVLANASPLSPAGSGDAAQWAAPITDRRGSRDAGTAPAVTERAPHPKQKDTQQTLGVLLFFSVPCGCLTPLPRSSRRCPPPCRFECR